MTNTSMMSPPLQSEAAATVHLFDNWFDAIEVGLRERVREFSWAFYGSLPRVFLTLPGAVGVGEGLIPEGMVCAIF